MEEKKSILVVDDDIALLKMAEALLKDCYLVSLAKSGNQALQFFSKGIVPDLILLDIDMPDMDGYETIKRLHQNPDAVDIPIIFLTGLTQAEAELRGLKAGAADYITKPFDREVLLARLEMHLKNGEQRKRMRILQQTLQNSGIDEERFANLSIELTPTEQRIARLIILGYSNQEICEELHYSYAYIKKVVCVVFDKLDVSRRSELRRLFL